jgi:hypothetical protein
MTGASDDVNDFRLADQVQSGLSLGRCALAAMIAGPEHDYPTRPGNARSGQPCMSW